MFFVYRRTVLSRLEFCDSKDPKHIGYEPPLRIESAYSGFFPASIGRIVRIAAPAIFFLATS